jgi:spore germination protein GerM
MHKLVWTVIFIVVAMVFTSCSSRMPKTHMDDKIEDEIDLQAEDHDLLEEDAMENLETEYNESSYLKGVPKEAQHEHRKVMVYFLNNEENKLEPEEQIIETTQSDQMLKEIVSCFIKGPQTKKLQPVVPREVKVEKVEYIENIAAVYLSKEFLDTEDLLIARAALVNTLVELDEINYVRIYVDGMELTDDGREDGQVLGLLTKYSNDLEQLEAEEFEAVSQGDVRQTKRELYFQDREKKFLLPEVRHFAVNKNKYIEAVVEELIKGPSKSDEGLYPTIPKGTRLLDVKLIEASDDNTSGGVELYFSNDLKSGFDSKINTENMMVGSLIYSLTGLSDVEWVKIFYQDENGEYIDKPIIAMKLEKNFSKKDLSWVLGRRIKVYFSDKKIMHLVPEYRAISGDCEEVATQIVNELIQGPSQDDHVDVIPPDISVGDINVRIKDRTAFVDLPLKLNPSRLGSAGETMALYAIVNSLTDPANTGDIRQVQFLVNGKKADCFGNMSLKDPFVRNPVLIKE